MQYPIREIIGLMEVHPFCELLLSGGAKAASENWRKIETKNANITIQSKKTDYKLTINIMCTNVKLPAYENIVLDVIVSGLAVCACH